MQKLALVDQCWKTRSHGDAGISTCLTTLPYGNTMNIMSLCWLFFIMMDSALLAQSNILIAPRQTDLMRPWLTLSQTFDHQFHFEITLPTYEQDIQIFNSRYFPRITSLYWETEREGKTKTSIGLPTH